MKHVEKTEDALWILDKSHKQNQRVTMPDEAKEALLGWLEVGGSELELLFVALDAAVYSTASDPRFGFSDEILQLSSNTAGA